MIYTADTPGERLDAFLARVAPEMSRSAAQKLIEQGAVLKNGKKIVRPVILTVLALLFVKIITGF